MYYCIWCSALVVLAVVVWSWDASCVHCMHTACVDHGQYNQCRTPYAVIHSLVLLKMDLMIPETC